MNPFFRFIRYRAFFFLLKLKKQKSRTKLWWHSETNPSLSAAAAAHLRPLFSVRVILFIAFFLLEKKTQQMMFTHPVRLAGYSGSGLSFSGLSPVKLPAGLTVATLRNSQKRILASSVLLPGEMKVRKRNKTEF